MSAYNPVRHVAGQRRRMRVGAEFKYCPDGSQVQFDEDCPGAPNAPGGGPVNIIDILKPGNWRPGGWVKKPVTTPYTPPSGTGGGGSPGPYTPPGGSGGSGGGTPYTPPGGTGGSGGPYTPPGGSADPPTWDIPVTPPGGPSGGGMPQPGNPLCAPACQVCPENQKRVTLPFVPGAGFTATVTAGSEVTFVGRPQYLFKPDRLIIGSSISAFFDVVNFIIGNKPQSLAQGNVAAEMYSEVATYVDMSFDQCYPGIDVVLIAKNKSAVTQTFQAQLVGWADMS